MTTNQLARLEHSERLIAVHCYLMRKPVPKYKQALQKLQAVLVRIDSKLGELFDIINRSVQP